MATNNALNTGTTPLPVSSGGIGASTITDHAILLGDGTSAINSTLLTDGQLLIGVTGADPIAAVLTQGPGITITSIAGSINIAASASSQWISSGSDIYFSTGKVGIGTGSFESHSELTISLETALAYGVTLNGTTNTVDGSSNSFGLNLVPTFSFANNTTNAYLNYSDPTFAMASGKTLTNAITYYATNNFTGNAGIIGTVYGYYYDGGGSLVGTINTHYGIYIANPVAGTTKKCAYFGGITIDTSQNVTGVSSLTASQITSTILGIGGTPSYPLDVSVAGAYIIGANFTGNITGAIASPCSVIALSASIKPSALLSSGYGINNTIVFDTTSVNITTAYGFYNAPTKTGANTLTNFYGAYFAAVSGGSTSNVALYAENIVIGTTGTSGISQTLLTPSIRMTTSPSSNYVMFCSNSSGDAVWANPAVHFPTAIAGTTNQITASASIGSITLSLSSTLVAPGTVDTTGNLTIRSASSLKFNNSSNTNFVAFQSGSSSTNTTWTLPIVDSTGTQFLQSNGSGVLSWGTPSGAVTSIAGTASQINASASTGAVTLSLSSTIVTPGTVAVNGSLNSNSTTTLNATTAYNLYLTGTQTAYDGSFIQAGIYFDGTLRNIGGANRNSHTIYLNPKFTISSTGSNAGTNAIYINCDYSNTGPGNSFTTTSGIYVDSGIDGGSGNSKVYGGYFNLPALTVSTGKMALYAANMGIGYDSVIVGTNSLVVSGGIGIGTSSINASALLNLSSTTKGFLTSVMTTTQKNAISSPATGLEVFDSTLGLPNWYNGVAWISPSTGGGGFSTVDSWTTSFCGAA